MAGSIVNATGVVRIVNLVVKLLVFLRETFIAGAFGAVAYTHLLQSRVGTGGIGRENGTIPFQYLSTQASKD